MRGSCYTGIFFKILRPKFPKVVQTPLKAEVFALFAEYGYRFKLKFSDKLQYILYNNIYMQEFTHKKVLFAIKFLKRGHLK